MLSEVPCPLIQLPQNVIEPFPEFVPVKSLCHTGWCETKYPTEMMICTAYV